jgi:hypothetical protein
MGLLGRWRQRREDENVAAQELEAVVQMADEDTTLLGEQLSALGVDSEGVELDETTRHDYQGALDAYEHAKHAVPRLAGADEVTAVVDTLSSGRYLLACVRASLEGRPRPELRPPCFFNPQHGPSARDVRYTVPGGRGTRTVPACAHDAARVEAGGKPEIRKVRVGGSDTPYWQAGEALLPYGKDWFTTGMLGVEGNRRENHVGGPGGL